MAILYTKATQLIRRLYDRRIKTPAVLEPALYFPNAQRFVAQWRAIHQEALTILASRGRTIPRFHEIMAEQSELSANDRHDWRILLLKAYGVRFERNLAACPTVAALLARCPEVLSASLSFMTPGKHIPVHRGPFRGVLRFYLVLDMPQTADGEPAAVLKVADQEYRLREGDSLLWDDTYPHEAWNRGSAIRTVLLLDVWRLGMPRDMAILSKGLIALAGTIIRLRRLNNKV